MSFSRPLYTPTRRHRERHALLLNRANAKWKEVAEMTAEHDRNTTAFWHAEAAALATPESKRVKQCEEEVASLRAQLKEAEETWRVAEGLYCETREAIIAKTAAIECRDSGRKVEVLTLLAQEHDAEAESAIPDANREVMAQEMYNRVVGACQLQASVEEWEGVLPGIRGVFRDAVAPFLHAALGPPDAAFASTHRQDSQYVFGSGWVTLGAHLPVGCVTCRRCHHFMPQWRSCFAPDGHLICSWCYERDPEILDPR